MYQRLILLTFLSAFLNAEDTTGPFLNDHLKLMIIYSVPNGSEDDFKKNVNIFWHSIEQQVDVHLSKCSISIQRPFKKGVDPNEICATVDMIFASKVYEEVFYKAMHEPLKANAEWTVYKQ